MPVIAERAPAKINLTLKVLGRRADGYHEIESVIAFAHHSADGVRLHVGDERGLEISGPFASTIGGPNLIDTALTRLAEADPQLVLGRVELEKCLPVAAGVGGGSADAAAVLRAVRTANPDRSNTIDWLAQAQALGADVPVCLKSRPALVCGIGETIFPLPSLPHLDIVLANAMQPVPPDKTARVFSALGAPPTRERDPEMRTLPLFADGGALIAAMRADGNDLAGAAEKVVPGSAAVRSALQALPGALYAGLSGAGPTAFAVFGSGEEAQAAALTLAQARPGWWVAADTIGG